MTEWRVVDSMGRAVPGEGTFLNPRSALYSATLLNAQELKNHRSAGYRVDPPVDPVPLAHLDLPRWADEIYESQPKMMPGRVPSTPAEQTRVNSLISSACAVEEEFGEDELEMFAATKRGE